MKTNVGIFLLTPILLVLFQNCGAAVAFSSENKPAETKLIPLENEEDEVRIPEVEESESCNKSPSDLVACILQSHGKSLKLGLIEEELGGVNSVAKSVCVTRKGCLEMVSTKFSVKGAYDRGYCDSNPNVVRLNDEDLATLLK